MGKGQNCEEEVNRVLIRTMGKHNNAPLERRLLFVTFPHASELEAVYRTFPVTSSVVTRAGCWPCR